MKLLRFLILSFICCGNVCASVSWMSPVAQVSRDLISAALATKLVWKNIRSEEPAFEHGSLINQFAHQVATCMGSICLAPVFSYLSEYIWPRTIPFSISRRLQVSAIASCGIMVASDLWKTSNANANSRCSKQRSRTYYSDAICMLGMTGYALHLAQAR